QAASPAKNTDDDPLRIASGSGHVSPGIPGARVRRDCSLGAGSERANDAGLDLPSRDPKGPCPIPEWRNLSGPVGTKKEHRTMAMKRREARGLEVIDGPEGAEMNGAGTRIAGEGRSTRRIGILSFSSPGHFYPLTALGRRLQSRGHDVVYFQVAD